MRKLMVSLFIVVWLAVMGGMMPVVSQEHNHDAINSLPLGVLGRPLPLRAGIGGFHDPVTTGVKDAQAYYDQGICYLHSYVWIEAARSFNQALRLDPKLAMGYLGLSYAYSGLNAGPAAAEAVRKARALAGELPGREQTRVAIRERQLQAIAQPASVELLRAYRAEIDNAISRYPQDAE